MARLPLTIAIRDYDFVAPLALGDVRPEGIDLTVVRTFDALRRVGDDPAVQGGEASFSRHVQRLATGDRSFVGLPAFVMREFRHRAFFVRRRSGLASMGDLAGKRVGLDAWPASGNTWSRALMREAGAGLDRVRWVVGPVNPGDPAAPPDRLPPGVDPVPSGRSLVEMLLASELDAVISAWEPAGFHEPGSPIVRLYPDYRAAEQAHYRQRGIFPAHHIVALRRDVAERHPWAVASLFEAFVAARDLADRQRWKLHEASAWLLRDLEEQAALFGPAYRPYGYRENRAMVAAFCAEQQAQGLIPAPIDPDTVFEP